MSKEEYDILIKECEKEVEKLCLSRWEKGEIVTTDEIIDIYKKELGYIPESFDFIV